jgi:hypothetical protein
MASELMVLSYRCFHNLNQPHFLESADNNIRADGAKAIAASTTLTNLTSLDLEFNGIGDDGAKAIAASTTLSNLTSLNLMAITSELMVLRLSLLPQP